MIKIALKKTTIRFILLVKAFGCEYLSVSFDTQEENA